jgi:hypothetical protein
VQARCIVQRSAPDGLRSGCGLVLARRIVQRSGQTLWASYLMLGFVLYVITLIGIVCHSWLARRSHGWLVRRSHSWLEKGWWHSLLAHSFHSCFEEEEFCALSTLLRCILWFAFITNTLPLDELLFP